ncbi:hypothetical protein LSTR_LSTR017654 [Laodelphax striatellus]|uniref:Uncharacterized protein n=1 Tax=Laodelphax striatellus TaxID=195883 RepID=A0A482XJH8_LAOST|nr:hypothetical protein LSTR_LSTR017654 [Laodelphax striatellus]
MSCRRIIEMGHDSIMNALIRADGIQQMKNSYLTCLIINCSEPDDPEEISESLWKTYDSPHTHALMGCLKEFHGHRITSFDYPRFSGLDQYWSSRCSIGNAKSNSEEELPARLSVYQMYYSLMLNENRIYNNNNSNNINDNRIYDNIVHLYKFPGCYIELNKPNLDCKYTIRSTLMHELNNMYRNTGITKLILRDRELQTLDYSFDEINITEIELLDLYKPSCLSKLENCNIAGVSTFCSEGCINKLSSLKFFALSFKLAIRNDFNRFLRVGVTKNIAYLDLNSNFLNFRHIKCLTEVLKDSNVISLNLSFNCFDSSCAKLLAEVLPYTTITYIDLHRNSIGHEGYTYLMDVIERTDVCWLSLSENGIEKDLTEEVDLSFHIVPRNNTPSTFQMRFLFKELVALNNSNDEFEFVIPREDIPINLHHYTSLIQYLLDAPFSNIHIYDIFYIINKMHDIHVMNKINAFISGIEQKFIAFFENHIKELVLRFRDDSFVDLVREFENLNFSNFVRSSLYHRVLFYVNKARTILHPFIYRMMHKYQITLFNDILEPNKKKDIISFFEKHSDFDDVQQLIDLLKS